MRDAPLPDRILHVPRRFVSHDWGGTETVLASLASEQLRQGWRPEVHTSLALSSVPVDEWNGIPVRRYRYCYPFIGLSDVQKLQMDKKGGNLLSLSLFLALVRASKVRILHAHALKRLGGEVFTAARLRKRPFVVTLHGGIFDVPASEVDQMIEAQKGKFEWGKLFGALFRSRKILDGADAVICVGRSEYESAGRILSHKRIYHLGNGVDADRFADGNGESFRRTHDIPAKALVLACYSRVDPQKDQATLVSAFESLALEFPMLYLLLAGPVTVAAYAEAIDQRIAASPFQSRIRLLGALPFSERAMADAYHACDIFVLPSRHEPFGIVILEAWSAGKPVVVSRVGGLNDLVSEGSDGLFFPSADPGACAASIRALLVKPELRGQLAQAGRRKASQEYSWKRIADQTEQIYQEAENHARARCNQP